MSFEQKIILISDLVYEYKVAYDDEERGGVEPEIQPETERALDGVSLDIQRGSFTAIIGRNGSGKSTLAKNINALLLPASGDILVGGMNTKDESLIWDIRRTVGMVFQNPDNQLVSAVVEDDIAFGPENLGIAPDEIRNRIRVSLEAVDMYEHRKMAPHLLSGGQKQRVAIAGVVAMRPDVIIFDEPTAMLDPEGRDEVLSVIRKLHDDGSTVLLITHFMSETVDADRIVIMDGGRVALDGSPSEVYARADMIESFGLKLPFAIDMARRLRDCGFDIAPDTLSADALADAIAASLCQKRQGEIYCR